MLLIAIFRDCFKQQMWSS